MFNGFCSNLFAISRNVSLSGQLLRSSYWMRVWFASQCPIKPFCGHSRCLDSSFVLIVNLELLCAHVYLTIPSSTILYVNYHNIVKSWSTIYMLDIILQHFSYMT